MKAIGAITFALGVLVLSACLALGLHSKMLFL